MVSSCPIIPARLLHGGVGGSVTTITGGVVDRGVVGTGGRIEAINILGAVGGVGETFGAIAVHHGGYFLSSFVVLIIPYPKGIVNPLSRFSFVNF